MDDFLNDGETFDDFIMRTEREIEIHRLNMDYHLSGMEHALREGSKFLYFQWALAAVALACAALSYVYGGYWLMASVPFSLGSLGPALVHRTYMKEWRKEFRAFDAPAVLKQVRDEMGKAEKAKRKSRWWRRVRRRR